MKLISSFILVVVFITGCTKTDHTPAELKSPDFRLTSLKGDRFCLSRQRDKIVVCVFWTTICNPCKKELRDFNELKARFGNHGVEFVGICTAPEDLNAVKEVVNQYKLESTILLDKGARVARKFKATVSPVTLIVKNGDTIIYQTSGYDDTIRKQIENKLELILLESETK